MKGWLLWGLLCVVFLAGVTLVSWGITLHNPNHYDNTSIEVAVLWTLAVEVLLSAMFVMFEWLDETFG